MELAGRYDGNLVALLSAHQSLGAPQPVKLFGSAELKKKYLPLCAAGSISAFALTETNAGSDPANMSTTAELAPDGESYILKGEKLWCTNGTIADLLVVMARDLKTRKISAFVVETAWEGVTVEHRCRFQRLRALANGVIRFKNVRVPRENLIGQEGRRLKIALKTLNTGRLTIPAACTGVAKVCLDISRRWATERVQWGAPIGKHEAIAHKLADMAATVFALDAVTQLASRMADMKNRDIRLEAAAAKELASVMCWQIADNAMQICGGRGYETERSLAQRGDKPVSIQRLMRDARINRIFEGSSEIMHLFAARQAVDKHLQTAGLLIDPKKKLGEKLAAFPRIALFYAKWYLGQHLGWGHWPRYADFGPFATHMRFLDRRSRKLARQVFHGMVVHGAKLERKQAFLFHLVDIGLELFAVAASISKACTMVAPSDPRSAEAIELADLFCRNARRRIDVLFR
ncbi:MAG: acyl-CoA dehydrogenase [Planctomycetota bacterium]